VGVVDGLRYVEMVLLAVLMIWIEFADIWIRRKIGRSREEARREREADEQENGFGSSANPNYDDDDDDMQL
jgi:hypothetical protein